MPVKSNIYLETNESSQYTELATALQVDQNFQHLPLMMNFHQTETLMR